MKKLSTDNAFFDFMGRIGDLVVLNVLFLLTSVPVVTIGMSATALYQVLFRRMRGECVYPAREYLEACRKEWKGATKLWIFFLLTGLLLLFDIFYAENLSGILDAAVGCVMTVWYTVLCYAFPLQARFENSGKDVLKNALLLAVKYFPYTLLIAALNAIPVICILMGAFPTMMAMPVYCFIGFGLTARINGFFFNKVFQMMIKCESIDNED